MKIKTQYQMSFGWKDATHKKITETALKETPYLEQYQDALATYAQQPDFDETRIFSNTHFYFPSAEKKSFFDPNGNENAYARYAYHVNEMSKSIDNNNIGDACEHAGRALHFLQDVTEQNHSHQGDILQKAQEQEIHIKFEDFAKDNQEKIFMLLNPPKHQKDETFDDLFIKTANYSAKSDFATEENKNNWSDLAKDGLSNALGATKAFLDKFNSLLNQRNQINR